jgi:hypothetical protein
MEMLTTKRQLLAITAVIAAVVMAIGTGVAELVAQPHAAAQPAQVVMARSANGALVPVPVASTSTGSIHATTQTSPTASAASTSPASQPVTYVKTASGAFAPVSLGLAVTPPQPTTRTS